MMLKFSSQKKGEGAVSEAIGFLLIFSLVMVGIGLIMLYGYPMLLEQQSNANVRNMERDMIVIQNDMKSLVYKNVPYKETSLQVSGGVLAVYNSSVTKSKFIVKNISEEFFNGESGQLRYESDSGESIIALENGAVMTRMEFQQGSAMLAEPRWFIDENEINGITTFIVTMINVTSDSVLSKNGVGVVKMQVIGSDYNSYTDVGDIEVTYVIESTTYNFSKAWENYFVNTLGMQKGPTTPTSSIYTINSIENLVIKRYDIEIISI